MIIPLFPSLKISLLALWAGKMSVGKFLNINPFPKNLVSRKRRFPGFDPHPGMRLGNYEGHINTPIPPQAKVVSCTLYCGMVFSIPPELVTQNS